MDEKINELPEQPVVPIDNLPEMLAFDTPRIWATAVQVFVNPGHALFVFREQFKGVATGPDVNGEVVISRNAGSVVMSLDVACAFKEMMNRVDFDAIAETKK